MKKIFEKYDLIKVSGLLVILSAILTWIIPYGYYQGEMVTEEIQRVGLTNFMQYGLLGMYYFTVIITFLFVLGGFYQVLSRTAGYQTLIRNLGRSVKGSEVPFILVVSAIIALLTSMVNEYFPLIVCIPFIVAILNRTKADKVVSVSTTFGAMLVGVLGSTYSTKVIGQITSVFVDSYSVIRWILLIVGWILLNVFSIIRLEKNRDEKEHENYDMFSFDDKKIPEKATTWPYLTMLILVFLTTALAYLPWSSWNITVFSDMTDWFNKLSLFGEPIISYIFGEFIAFGTWDMYIIQFVLLFATLLIHWFGKVSWDDVFESYGRGFKKISYTVVVVLFVYTILVLAIRPASYNNLPILPVLVDKIASLSKGFNVVLSFISASITSLFTVEPQYMLGLAGSYFAGNYAQNLDILAIIFQTAFGLIGFVAPSSVILMIGLSYTGVSYKDWLKHIWKFFLAMFIVIVIILAVMQLAVL